MNKHSNGGNGVMFDKNRCISNIYALAKEKNLKIGELEENAGVSKGYLSRINKESSATNPPIDFLVSIAEQLDVSLDYLTKYSDKNYSENEAFVVEFIERLASETISGELEWIVQVKGVLDAENDSNVDNPLIDVTQDYSTDFDVLSPCHRYTSHFYGGTTLINGDAFYCTPISDSMARVYIMNVRYQDFDEGLELNIITNEYRCGRVPKDAMEVYLCIGDEVNTVCSTAYVKADIAASVERLYETINNKSSRLGLSNDAKKMMKRFLDN